VNRRSAVVSGVACALSYGPFAHAAPPVIAQTEISYLLGFIERSGCMFYRNGSWYDATQAQAHLRSKYDTLAAMGRILTAEDFIEQAATKSSLSGEAYAIRCNSGPAVSTDQWLRDALARFRHAAG
jgi:2,4-dienoyl-CoA reductase-like NADH-dependent reductase (Old Yellow Enzyme family)